MGSLMPFQAIIEHFRHAVYIHLYDNQKQKIEILPSSFFGITITTQLISLYSAIFRRQAVNYLNFFFYFVKLRLPFKTKYIKKIDGSIFNSSKSSRNQHMATPITIKQHYIVVIHSNSEMEFQIKNVSVENVLPSIHNLSHQSYPILPCAFNANYAFPYFQQSSPIFPFPRMSLLDGQTYLKGMASSQDSWLKMSRRGLTFWTSSINRLYKALIQISMASFFNLDQMGEFESYGEHLFGLGRRFVHFCQEDALEEHENRLETKISSCEKTGGEGKSENPSSPDVLLDSQFQTCFMKEHAFILHKYVRNNKSLFLKQEDPAQPPSSSHPQLNLADALWSCSAQLQALTGTKMSIVISCLLQHNKITSYLCQILEKFEEKVSFSLLKMGVLVWMEYCRLNVKSLEERKIIEFSNRLLSSSFLTKIRNLLPAPNQQVTLSSLKAFANVFVTTFLFVAFEYFVNPYYQLQEELLVKDYQSYQILLYDTALNDWEEEDEECEQISGRKLVKLTSEVDLD